MSIRVLKIGLCCWLLLLLTAGRATAGTEKGAEHVRLADGYLAAGDNLRAAANYRQAISEGMRLPEVYNNLSLALYDLRMVDEAIASMEEAAHLDPGNLFVALKLGTLYFAGGKWQQAVASFGKGMEKYPANGASYFYLGEAFYRLKRYDYAWLAAWTALKLRFDSSLLVDKLRQVGASEPKGSFFVSAGGDIAIRELLLIKEEDVKKFLSEWDNGASFESITSQFKGGEEAAMGGYVGEFSPGELKEPIRQALAGQQPYHRPVAVDVDEGTLLVQRVLPFSLERWQRQLNGEPPLAASPETKPETLLKSAPSPEMSDLELSGIDHQKIVVYAGTFSVVENAVEMVMRLRDLGYEAFFLQETRENDRKLFHVIAGQFDSVADARQIMERLRQQGYESFSPGL